MPYKMNVALNVIYRIGFEFTDGFKLEDNDKEYYSQLIRYFHGDESFDGDLTKGLLIMGNTGTGKSLSLQIMKTYRSIDNICFIIEGSIYNLDYDITTGYDINNSFMNNGFDGLIDYCNRKVLYIDDFGLETREVTHFGSKIDAVEYILNERYRKKLLTFATTNMNRAILEDTYGDRMASRFKEMFNYVILKGNDKRK